MATENDPNQPGAIHRLVVAAEKIGLKSLSTGHFIWFVVLIIGGLAVWKLDSKDLKEVLLKVLVTYGWTGYLVAAITIFFSYKILNWREKFYQQEMARIGAVKNELMQAKFELPLQSSVEKKEQK